MRPHTLSVRLRFVTITSGSTSPPLSSNRFPESEHDTQRLRILRAGDGNGKSDIGGGEFCTIILRLGGDSEMLIGWRWWLVVTVVAAMAAMVWLLLLLLLLCSCF